MKIKKSLLTIIAFVFIFSSLVSVKTNAIDDDWIYNITTPLEIQVFAATKVNTRIFDQPFTTSTVVRTLPLNSVLAVDQHVKNWQNVEFYRLTTGGYILLSDVSRINYVRPAQGNITSSYGNRTYPSVGFHTGVDIGSGNGLKIVATRGGTVSQIGYSSSYGNYIIINHDGGIQSLYAHLANSGTYVSLNQKVVQGQQIARMGSTGNSTGTHLHFEIRLNSTHVNPANYVNFTGYSFICTTACRAD